MSPFARKRFKEMEQSPILFELKERIKEWGLNSTSHGKYIY